MNDIEKIKEKSIAFFNGKLSMDINPFKEINLEEIDKKEILDIIFPFLVKDIFLPIEESCQLIKSKKSNKKKTKITIKNTLITLKDKDRYSNIYGYAGLESKDYTTLNFIVLDIIASIDSIINYKEKIKEAKNSVTAQYSIKYIKEARQNFLMNYHDFHAALQFTFGDEFYYSFTKTKSSHLW